MYFLIGVVILILFIIFTYFFIKKKIRSILDRAGFSGVNLSDVINESKIEDMEQPKSLSSLDSVYLTNINRDFPELNINELKSKAEKVILDSYNAVESKDVSNLNGKFLSFVEDMMNDYKDKKVSFEEFKFHNTVVSKYSNDKGIATIVFGSSYEYILNIDGNQRKVQDRARVEFIYVIDIDKVPSNLRALGINCPNCGSPIKSLGIKTCSYCGSAIREVFGHVFTCNNIVRY